MNSDINIQCTNPLHCTVPLLIVACSKLTRPTLPLRSPAKLSSIALPTPHAPCQDHPAVYWYLGNVCGGRVLAHATDVNGVHVRGIGRPFYNCKCLFFEPFFGNFSCMYCSIV